MASASPPTENLPEFNSAVFKSKNGSALSLSQAQSLFLGRTGNATSVATSTNFSDDVNVSNGDITITGGRITLNGTGIEYDSTGENVGFGSINLGTNQNTCLGSGTSSAGDYGVAIGYSSDVQSGTSGCMAIGPNSSVATNLTNAVALGNNATATTNNTIVLGTSTETVRCPGNVSNISLVATKSIYVNGNILVGTKGTGSNNTILGNLAGDALTNQGGNTFIGYASGVAYAGASGANNICIGNSCGASLTAGTENVIIGRNSVFNSAPEQTSASRITVIGANSTITTGVINATSIGYDTRLTGNYAVAIGYQVSAGANQIVLGRAEETVYCPGTASNTSLVATSNITVNGLTVGTSNTSGAVGNTLFGVNAGTAINSASADHNTLIGNTAGAAITSGARNTAVGFAALNANQTTADNTAVGYNALNLYTGQSGFTPATAVGSNALSKLTQGGFTCAFGTNALLNATGSSNVAFGANAGASITSGANNVIVGGDYPVGGSPANAVKISSGSFNTFIGQAPTCATDTTANATIIGSSCTITGNYGCAIGSGSTAAANQISLGRTNEYVTCKGTNTTNGALQLDGPLRLQTGTYGATPGANMLGYQLALTAVAITSIPSINVVQFGSLVLTPGVWALNFSVELSVTSAGGATVTNHTFYFSTSSGGGFGASRIANTGAIVNRASTTYAYDDRPVFSGGGCLYSSAGQTIYPSIYLSYSGTIVGTGWANATRIG